MMENVFAVLFMAFLPVVVLYIPIAIAVVAIVLVKSKTRRLFNTVIAVIVLILIPTWDSLLGEVVYAYSSHFLAGAVIYDTVQADQYPTVRITKTHIGTALIVKKRIYNSSTNKLMAEYCRVCKDKRPPYFAWHFARNPFSDDEMGDCMPSQGPGFENPNADL